jgi:hypothetical protein
MNRLNQFPRNLMNMSLASMVAVAVTAGTMAGGGLGSYAAAAQPVSAVITTMPFPGPGPVLTTFPTPGPYVTLVAYAGYELGRHAWAKYDGPRTLSKAYEATRRAAGSVMRFGKAAVTTVSGTAVQVVDATHSKAATIRDWLWE